jgi:hypothetical protein
MPRFSDTVHADATLEQSWEKLQDAGVWGTLLGAAEIGDIRVEDGQLQSCKWTAKIGGTDIKGKMKVKESRPSDYMDVMVRTAEWRCRIEMVLTATDGDSPQTEVHSRVYLTADGFTAVFALPVVANVLGKYFPQRMLDLAEMMGEGGTPADS